MKSLRKKAKKPFATKITEIKRAFSVVESLSACPSWVERLIPVNLFFKTG
jgi:hypothetical protein